MTPYSVWVMDASAIIEAKRVVRANAQWRLFRLLEEMVEAGDLYFPKQVTAELNQKRHIDMPEAWALEAGPKVMQAYDPDQKFVSRVMQVAGDVIDPDSEREQADPYVIAQALELMDLGLVLTLITEDVVDRFPVKASILTACQRLHVPTCRLAEFLRQIGF